MLDLSIIIPTYCEAGNLPLLVERLNASMTGCNAEIIIVDDNSPDGTPEVIASLNSKLPIRLIIREHERGLSTAVLCGLDAAKGEMLLVMDADLSHPPESIPALVAALDDATVDFVIGSRYVAGGSTGDTWSFARWVNSKIATLMARPFTSTCDPMAGFFALRRTTYERGRETLDPIGYKIGLELIVKCRCRNITEVPIHFVDRIQGDSKLNWKEQVNYVRHLGRLLRFQVLQQLRSAAVPHEGAGHVASANGVMHQPRPGA